MRKKYIYKFVLRILLIFYIYYKAESLFIICLSPKNIQNLEVKIYPNLLCLINY